MSKKANRPTQLTGAVLPDGTLIESLWEPWKEQGRFAIRRPSGMVELTQKGEPIRLIELEGKEFVPCTDDNVRDGVVLLPSEVGEPPEFDELLGHIEGFIFAHWDCRDSYRKLCAAYVIMSWLHDAYTTLPYLHLTGIWGTGKTVGLKVLGSISYHSVNLGAAASDAVLYRVIDKYRGTLLLDEADMAGSTDLWACATKILNVGYRSDGVIWRCNTDKNNQPEAFRAFGPKVVCTREGFSDKALLSRCLTHDCYVTSREDISLTLPPSHKWEDAIKIRNWLLGFRFKHWDGQKQFEPVYLESGLEPRLQEVIIPLKGILPAGQQAIIDDFIYEYQRTVLEEERLQWPCIILEAILECIEQEEFPILVGKLGAKASESAMDDDVVLKARRVGAILRKHLGLKTHRTRAGYALQLDERALTAACRRFGLDPPTNLPTQAQLL